jgi:hypothetical protein
MDINEQTITSTFQRLRNYIATEYQPIIKLFTSDTVVLIQAINHEYARRFRTHKKLNESFDNELIIKEVHVWFRKFLIVNQLSHLLYYGTATTVEEKQIFESISGSSDFESISHPTAKRIYDLGLKKKLDDDDNDKGAAILYNKNQISDTDDSDLDLCCFSITFYTDDLNLKTYQKNNMFVLSSNNLPTLEVPFEEVRKII